MARPSQDGRMLAASTPLETDVRHSRKVLGTESRSRLRTRLDEFAGCRAEHERAIVSRIL